MNKFFSLSLGLVLFSGPLMSTISNYLGIDIYLQFIVLLAWILIFIVKNNIKIYSNIVELITANKLLSLLLVTMYIGMVVQINPYLIFENFINFDVKILCSFFLITFPILDFKKVLHILVNNISCL